MARKTMLAPRQEEDLRHASMAARQVYHDKLCLAYDRTYGRYVWNAGRPQLTGQEFPCQTCSSGVASHATVWGEAICTACYEAANYPCCQLYPGDLGLAPFPIK